MLRNLFKINSLLRFSRKFIVNITVPTPPEGVTDFDVKIIKKKVN